MTDGERDKLAGDIYSLLGGGENILSVTNCMTRLRARLGERRGDMAEKIKALPGILIFSIIAIIN